MLTDRSELVTAHCSLPWFATGTGVHDQLPIAKPYATGEIKNWSALKFLTEELVLHIIKVAFKCEQHFLCS